MKIAQKLIKEDMIRFSDAEIKSALQNRISNLGFENAYIDDVTSDEDGDVVVSFTNEDGEFMEVLFTYDLVDGAEAIILTDDIADSEDDDFEDDGELELDMIDLDPLEPALIKNGDTIGIDLINNSWINSSVLQAILNFGDFMGDDETDDAFDEARKAFVIRGGKKVRVSLARRKKRKRLSSKQRLAVRKAVRTRRLKRSQIKRKRAKSLRVRKRLGLKTIKGRGKVLIRGA